MSSLEWRAASDAPARTTPTEMPLALIVMIGVATAFALCWPHVLTLWTTGTYNDTDDAMRMVQVRDWLAGQGWYDLVAHRLDPPAGASMHWSRVVDLPLAALIRLFGLFAAPETADRLTRLVFPLSMQVLLLTGVALCGRVLAGTFGSMVAVALAVGSGFMFGQFVPGRIDHHAPQIVLLVFATYGLLRALDPAHPRFAVLCGFCAALTLAIALENLPFVFVLAAVFPVAWIAQGAPMRPALAGFAATFGGSLLALFALFNAPAAWLAPACDALSIVHVEMALAGSAAMLAIAVLDRIRRPGLACRALAMLAAGSITAIPLLLHRQCLLDPFTGLDPLVREVWLSNVTEARSIPAFLRIQPGAWPMLILPWALGTSALAVACFVERGLARMRLLALLALCLAGSATAAYMVRSTANVAPIALLGGVWLCAKLSVLLSERSRAAMIASVVLVAAPFTSFAWALVPGEENAQEAERLRGTALCKQPDGFAALAALPPSLVLAPIDSGPHLLVHTPHAVVGAPYHRNNHGNRLVLDAFLAPPLEAEAIVRRSGARYVALCPGQAQVSTMAARAPEGLAARLAAGQSPAWLRALPLTGTPFRIFEVLPPS